MVVYTRETRQNIDHTPALTGSADESCQCPHWGSILKGQMHCMVADHEEVFNEGDVFYLLPGNNVIAKAADTKYIILMPADEWEKEVTKRS